MICTPVSISLKQRPFRHRPSKQWKLLFTWIIHSYLEHLRILSMASAQPEKKKERPSALRSIIAGSTAGAVEIGMFFAPPWKQDRQAMNQWSWLGGLLAITYPAECMFLSRVLRARCPFGNGLEWFWSGGVKMEWRRGALLIATTTVAKTRTQLNRRLASSEKLPWPPFGKAWYAGCTTLIIGNSLKAGIRESCLPGLLEDNADLDRVRGFWSV